MKNNSTTNNYTFIDEIITTDPLKKSPIPIENEVWNEQATIEEKYKKKKVMSKYETSKDNHKGLKFTNQSQRNHSSIYE